MLTPEQKAVLLRLAREAVEHAVREQNAPDYFDADPGLIESLGVFVSLHTLEGELRGCIGFPEARYPLWQAVVQAARLSALSDFRFHPVTEPELPNLRIEISVLTPPQQVRDINEIKVGRHGLIISRGGQRGLLLPQVAPEWKWNREEFLQHTCQKASLPPDAWKNGALIESFEAEVFEEQ